MFHRASRPGAATWRAAREHDANGPHGACCPGRTRRVKWARSSRCRRLSACPAIDRLHLIRLPRRAALPCPPWTRRLDGRNARHLGLRHRRRRHRGLRAREPPLRRSRRQRAAARSGRQGRLDLDPHPGRLSVLHRQSAHRLVLSHRAGPGPERPLDPLRAWQGARRLLVDQRDALSPRPAARLRRVGAVHRRQRVVVGERAAAVQALRGSPRRRERRAFGGRRVARGEAAAVVGHPGRVPRGDGAGRHSESRRFQRRRQRGRGVLRGESAPRRALERDEGVPAAGDEPPQPDGDDRCNGESHRLEDRRATGVELRRGGET